MQKRRTAKRKEEKNRYREEGTEVRKKKIYKK